jgi:hypothetical protein
MILHGFLAHPPKTHLEMFRMILSWFFFANKNHTKRSQDRQETARGVL